MIRCLPKESQHGSDRLYEQIMRAEHDQCPEVSQVGAWKLKSKIASQEQEGMVKRWCCGGP